MGLSSNDLAFQLMVKRKEIQRKCRASFQKCLKNLTSYSIERLYKLVYGSKMLIYSHKDVGQFEVTDQEVVCPGWTPAVRAAGCLK